MKWSMLVLLVVIVLAGWLGTLIARDPGYVLISYRGASFQTSLWVALGLLAIAAGVVYWILRFFRFLSGTSDSLRAWRNVRTKSHANDVTAKGLKFFLEGESERAERFLVSGSDNDISPAINYLIAARAANDQGKNEQRESYLRQAIEADSTLDQAVGLTAAKMSAAREEWRQCLDFLSLLKTNDAVMFLKKDALFGLRDWQGLLDLLPKLKKSMSKESFLALEKEVAIARFSKDEAAEGGLNSHYKKLSDEVKKDTEVVLAYCSQVKDAAEAEIVLRQAIKDNWQRELLECYGNLGPETLGKRLKQVQAWCLKHKEDAGLQLCLGKIHEASGDRDKARSSFEKSINLEDSREANEHLAGLLSFDGDYAKSNEHFKSALRLKH